MAVPVFGRHVEAVVTALVLVTGTCLFVAAFDVGGPGVGYLSISIIPLLICTVAVRCIVVNGVQVDYGGGGGDDGPKWPPFFLGACVAMLMCLPITLFRLRLIDPLSFLFAVLGVEIQGIAIAISALSAMKTTAMDAYGGGGDGGW